MSVLLNCNNYLSIRSCQIFLQSPPYSRFSFISDSQGQTRDGTSRVRSSTRDCFPNRSSSLHFMTKSANYCNSLQAR
eukprot:6211916-Pleurochrysis_carterae.AAC.5